MLSPRGNPSRGAGFAHCHRVWMSVAFLSSLQFSPCPLLCSTQGAGRAKIWEVTANLPPQHPLT